MRQEEDSLKGGTDWQSLEGGIAGKVKLIVYLLLGLSCGVGAVYLTPKPYTPALFIAPGVIIGLVLFVVIVEYFHQPKMAQEVRSRRDLVIAEWTYDLADWDWTIGHSGNAKGTIVPSLISGTLSAFVVGVAAAIASVPRAAIGWGMCFGGLMTGVVGMLLSMRERNALQSTNRTALFSRSVILLGDMAIVINNADLPANTATNITLTGCRVGTTNEPTFQRTTLELDCISTMRGAVTQLSFRLVVPNAHAATLNQVVQAYRAIAEKNQRV